MHMWLLALDVDLRSRGRQINSHYFPVTCCSGLSHFQRRLLAEGRLGSSKRGGVEGSPTTVAYSYRVQKYHKLLAQAKGSIRVKRTVKCFMLPTWGQHFETVNTVALQICTGEKNHTAKRRTVMISDKPGSNTKPLHLLAITKSFSQTWEQPASAHSENQSRKMAWKNVQT